MENGWGYKIVNLCKDGEGDRVQNRYHVQNRGGG